MTRYDFRRFRKEHGINQKDLAKVLRVTQGFLSSIENGNNLFPTERWQYLYDEYPEVNFENYLMPEEETSKSNSSGAVDKTNSDNQDTSFNINDPVVINKFIDLVRDELTQSKKEVADDSQLRQDLMTLSADNNRLRDKIDSLQEKIFELQNEVVRLKYILADHNIKA